MKKIILPLACLIAIATAQTTVFPKTTVLPKTTLMAGGVAAGVLTHVSNDGNGSCSSDVSATCAISYTPTQAGDVVVISGDMFIGVSGVTLNSVTDNGGGGSSTYNCEVNGSTSPVSGTAIIFWMCRTLNVKASVTTITLTFSAAGTSHYPGVNIMEFHDSAGAGTSTFDQVSGSNTATSGSVSTLALTPAVTGELSLMGIFQSTSASFTFTGTNGWTCQNKADPNTNISALCWQIISGTGSTTATATITSLQWIAWQSMYKP